MSNLTSSATAASPQPPRKWAWLWEAARKPLESVADTNYHDCGLKPAPLEVEELLSLRQQKTELTARLIEVHGALILAKDELQELTEKARYERVRYEQEKVAQLEEWKRRAVIAEHELRDQCARTANANERASRKRDRVDADKVMQLVRVEVELSNLRQEKIDLKAQLNDVQGQNRDQQQTIWSLQRGTDNLLTRLNIEHEARVTQLETQIGTLELKSLAALMSGAGGLGLSPRG